MEKYDLRQQYKYLYTPSAKKVEVVDVPPLQFTMIDGTIPPELGPGESPEFQEDVSTLYGISYTLKFMVYWSEIPNPNLQFQCRSPLSSQSEFVL
jgi:hypothetical protein